MVTISCINVCAVKAQRNAFNLAQNRPTISATFLNISIWYQTSFEHACAGRVTLRRFRRTYYLHFRSKRDVFIDV